MDFGCGIGSSIKEVIKFKPKKITGIDISDYAIENCKEEINECLIVGNASKLELPDNTFDLVISLNTLHNLFVYDLENAISEINRVKKNNSYICVESYRTEEEKANLLYWQVTCESFYNPDEWEWLFKKLDYTGDYSFIYFE